MYLQEIIKISSRESLSYVDLDKNILIIGNFVRYILLYLKLCEYESEYNYEYYLRIMYDLC